MDKVDDVDVVDVVDDVDYVDNGHHCPQKSKRVHIVLTLRVFNV